MGQQLASNPFDGLALEDVIDGFRSGFAGSPLAVSKEALNAAFEEIQTRMTRSNSEKHADAIKQGEEFLEKNAKREEVTVTSFWIAIRSDQVWRWRYARPIFNSSNTLPWKH